MIVALTLLAGLLFSGPSTEDVKRAVKNVFDDPRLQTEFPERPPPRTAEASDPAPFEASPDDPETSPDHGLVPPIAFFEVVLWVLVGVVVVLTVLSLARRLGGYTAPVRVAATAPGDAAAPAPPGVAADADALAAEGRYDEAVHHLLLIALDLVARADPLPGSLTSREILLKRAIADAARPPLGLLVRAVEQTLFGAQPADEARYQDCREAFDQVAAALAPVTQ